jgi:tRNA 2-selenouridine synthase
MQRLGVEDFLAGASGGRIVDVRSPAEYQKGHIPGAINIPIFTNQERAEVGTVYKQKSREEAILRGLDIVGPKLRKIADAGKQQAISNTLHIYCWRGGMRSEKMAWLFDLSGVQTKVLKGGYKAYRQFGKQIINRLEEYVIVQGPTGSGKTEIIQALKDLGEQVIDLEGLAHHKGSAFGGLGQEKQPNTQQFQNEIYRQINSFDQSRPVWLESESATIGKVYLPEELWVRMNSASVMSINVPLQERLNNIIRQYGSFPKNSLIAKVEQLRQNLGGALVKEIIELIERDNLPLAVEKLLSYYDKTYSYSAKHHKTTKPVEVDLEEIKPRQNALTLIHKYKEVLV